MKYCNLHNMYKEYKLFMKFSRVQKHIFEKGSTKTS